MKNKDFIDRLSTIFLISKEMVKGHGEDNFYCSYSDNAAVLCVLDGCGGLGSQTYKQLKGHTGAYIASRIVSGAVHDWFHECGEKHWRSETELMECLDRKYIQKAYDKGASRAKSNLRISGSMVRDLPTTMAMAYANMENDNIILRVIWAGDSRVYYMDEEGIAQVTKDDVKSDDALSNLSDDGALTNVLSSDKNYTLRYKKKLLNRPAVIFTATDGCFGYLPTPMHFEYEILRILLNSKNQKEFKMSLKKFFEETAGDDFTFAFMGFGYDTFQEMQRAYEPRKKFLEREYMSKLEKDPDNEELIVNLWQNYRKSYERMQGRKPEERN